MSDIEHAFARHKAHVFARVDHDGSGQGFIARFWTGAEYLPIFFPSRTEMGARIKLEKFRFETITKYEGKARQKNAKKNKPVMDESVHHEE